MSNAVWQERRPFHRRQYVRVRVDYDEKGHITPLIFGTQNGVYRIDQIMEERQAISQYSAREGVRYTCRVNNEMLYLFFENRMWFIEAIGEQQA